LMTTVLWIACWKYLPETLAPEKRQSLHPAYLGRAYLKVLTSLPFLLASGALSLNFSGFFVYVLSAPVFLMTHLGVPETGFLWLFGPAMGGLMLGSWLAGHRAGKHSPGTTVNLGYGVMAGAALLNLGINLSLPPALPWSVAPLFVYTLGMSLAMPNLTLFALDPFPDNRGMAASCQTFVQSGSNGLVAALVAPLVWGSTLSLALTMSGFLVLGGIAALLYRRSVLLPG
jgi:DHA1 family bicyclomycin/chloramphenicol resistance-like MFS transporter